jgi:hypothetical protein
MRWTQPTEPREEAIMSDVVPLIRWLTARGDNLECAEGPRRPPGGVGRTGGLSREVAPDGGLVASGRGRVHVDRGVLLPAGHRTTENGC